MRVLVDVLKGTEAWLRDRGVPHPRPDAERLIAHVLGTTRLQIYLMYDRPLTDLELDQLRPLVARRGKREPLGWILGEVGFHHIDLQVLPGVLVPRPDSETLVEVALGLMREHDPEDDSPVFVADVGAGTGAIGLALAKANPRARVYATDPSPEALACARLNVQRLELSTRVAILEGSLLHPIPPHRPIDWVVSNPPYIPTAQIAELEPEVRDHEPRLALDGGADGLDVYRSLITQARQRARRGLAVEIGHDQGAAVRDLFEAAGFDAVAIHPDLAGRDRVVCGLQPA